MSNYLTEAGEMTRRFDLAAHEVDRAHRADRSEHEPGSRATRRHQLATTLRRFADRLEQ